MTTANSALVIQKPCIVVSTWQKRQEPLRQYTTMSKPWKAAKFLIKAPLDYKTVTYRAKTLPDRPQAVFRERSNIAPPIKPEGPQIMESGLQEDVPIEAVGEAVRSAE
jgi:hypothetical protein